MMHKYIFRTGTLVVLMSGGIPDKSRVVKGIIGRLVRVAGKHEGQHQSANHREE